jgi:hypothetical protein
LFPAKLLQLRTPSSAADEYEAKIIVSKLPDCLSDGVEFVSQT